VITRTLTVGDTSAWCRRDAVGWNFREVQRDIVTRTAMRESDALVNCTIRSHDGQLLTSWAVEVEQPDETEPALT